MNIVFNKKNGGFYIVIKYTPFDLMELPLQAALVNTSQLVD